MSDVVRLYRFFIPNRYKLLIKPNKNKLSFEGRVVLNGRLTKNFQQLKLHSKDLNIANVAVNNQDTTYHLLPDTDELVIDLPHLDGYDLEVAIEFSGKITKQMHGLYPCYGRQGEIILATQLESHHAREVFPCIDEPEAKAIFCLTLTTEKAKCIISNTLPLSTKLDRQVVTTIFKPTPVMSPYLLAFVIGDLTMRQTKTKQGIVIRTWSTNDQNQNTEFSMAVAVKSIEFFNNYFQIPYPLEKCDFVALPDFAAGAMENWGLITFRESCMLVDPKNTSLDAKQYVAMVVAHEIAHQWFGNLVTMRWWNDLWLNEGFASWIEYLAVDNMFPEWHMWTQFIANDQQMALRLDALKNTHPIAVSVPNPDEIPTIFDTISYTKGAAVIYMLHQFLGKNHFRQGIISYLKKHAYTSTTTEDLWEALEACSHKPVREFMSTWINQPGFPLVKASYKNQQLKLSQKRFGIKNYDQPTIWSIPLLSSALSLSILNQKAVSLGKINNLSGFKLNHNQAGFYITKYWPSHYNCLGNQVSTGKLNEVDRVGLLADMLALTKIGDLPLAKLIKMLSFYKNETSSPVWDNIALLLSDIRRVMGNEVREAIKPLVRKLTASQLDKLGWCEINQESYFDKLLRPTVLALAAGADNLSVVKEAKQRFENAKSIDNLPSNLRSMILGTVSKNGAKAEFDKMLEWFRCNSSAEDKVTLSNCLTNFRRPSEYKRALKLIRSKDVKLQDVSYWITAALANPKARDDAWEWLKDNWQWLKQNTGNDIGFSRFPVYVARVYSDINFLTEYRQFFKSVHEASLNRSIKQGVETIKLQAAWRQRDEKRLLKWLEKQAS